MQAAPRYNPPRAQIQNTLSKFRRRSTARGVSLFLLNAALYCVSVWGVVFIPALWLRFACSLALGLLNGLLFVVGHDACHQSLTPRRRLNQLIGRLAFLPSLQTS